MHRTISAYLAVFILQHVKNRYTHLIHTVLHHGQYDPQHVNNLIQNHKQSYNRVFDRFCTAVFQCTGSAITFAVVVVLSFVWLALGPIGSWGDTWQLIYNSATSTAILPVVFILQAAEQSEMIELLERLHTSVHYLQTHASTTHTHSHGVFDKLSSGAAVVIGHGATFYLAVLSVIAWAVCGQFLDYNDTWWLIINTATSVITYLVLFPLHNTELQRRKVILHHTACALTVQDKVAHITTGKSVPQQIGTQFDRLSNMLSVSCAHPLAFLFAIATAVVWAIFGPVLDYNNTWQLIANTYTMGMQLFLFILLQHAINQSTQQIHAQLTQLQLKHYQLHETPVQLPVSDGKPSDILLDIAAETQGTTIDEGDKVEEDIGAGAQQFDGATQVHT